METICMLIFFLSFLAFVVGMFNPQNVKLKSRGKVALVYLGVCLVAVVIASSFNESETGNSVSQRERTSVSMEDADQEQEAEGSIGKPVEVGHFIYTVQSVSFRKSIGDEWFGETADGVYLLVNLTIKNISGETRTLDGSLFSVTDRDGVKYESSVEATTALEMSGAKTLFLKKCQPNITTKGVLVFEVPQRDEYYLHLLGNFWGSSSVRVLLK